MRFLVSAGEASGDLYAAGVLSHLRTMLPHAEFYGCAGPKLQALGVEPVIDASSLAVVGLAEVVSHLPRIYAEFRKLVRTIRKRPPVAALLTDNPDFNLRVARHLKRMNVPVFYLVAPQVWAWRQGRVKGIRQVVNKLFCLFPFEERWFRERGVDATYIGHPLANIVRSTSTRDEFLQRHGLQGDWKTIVLLPGSRAGETARHLPDLLEAVRMLRRRFSLNVLLASPRGFGSRMISQKFKEPIDSLAIKTVEDQTWDCIGHADVALAASGTVTVETAILGTPMVTFYKVSPLSWHAGRRLVKVPFFSMVNLIAGRQIVPELIQSAMTPQHLADATARLLTDKAEAQCMRTDLAAVRSALHTEGDPFYTVARAICSAAGLLPAPEGLGATSEWPQ